MTAAATYAHNVGLLRQEIAAAADALYETWLTTDMSAIERDRRAANLRAREAAGIEAERQLYYANLAKETA